MKRAIVVGGAGALGRSVLRAFKKRAGWTTANIDFE